MTVFVSEFTCTAAYSAAGEQYSSHVGGLSSLARTAYLRIAWGHGANLSS